VALREFCLFAGAGGGILGSILLGWRTVCAVEIDQLNFKRRNDEIHHIQTRDGSRLCRESEEDDTKSPKGAEARWKDGTS